MKLTKPASPALSSKKPFPVRLGWMVIIALIAGITIGAVGTWLLAEQVDQLRTNLTKSSSREQVAVVPQVNVETPTTESVDAQKEKMTQVLEVMWAKPTLLLKTNTRNLLMGATTSTELVARAMAEERSEDVSKQLDSLVRRVWSVGRVVTDPLKDFDLYYIELEGINEMMGGPAYIYHFFAHKKSDDTGALYLITENTEWYRTYTEDPFYRIVQPIDGKVTGLDMSKSLQLENGKWLQFLTSEQEIVAPSAIAQMQIIAKTVSGDPIYVRTDGYRSSGFLDGRISSIGVFDPIGRFQQYGSFMGMHQQEDDSEYHGYFLKTVTTSSLRLDPTIEQPSGSVEYSPMTQTGCGEGAINGTNIRIDALWQIGTSVDGDPIYVPKDMLNAEDTKMTYDQWLTFRSVKPSLEEFLESNPLPYFFWKDATGSLIKYTSTAVVPPGECGKPVIYLYPEKTTDVRVSLPKFINVTVSDPTYPSKGWVVTANPNGDLVSHADGKTYGSLFWEGTGVGYQAPTTGFVVKREEVSSFFASTLPKYGLNQKESQEFMDFWVPRMASSSYYQVSFLTDTWSKAAPLNVFPRPKTSIRIFMDLKPLSAPISIKAPTIITPKRNGFTLVEWGGLLY